MKLVRTIATGSLEKLLQEYGKTKDDVIELHPGGHDSWMTFAHPEGVVLRNQEDTAFVLNGEKILYEDDPHAFHPHQTMQGVLIVEHDRCYMNGTLLYEGPGGKQPHPEGVMVVNDSIVTLHTKDGSVVLTKKYDGFHQLVPAIGGCLIIDVEETGKVWRNNEYLFTLPEAIKTPTSEYCRYDLDKDCVYGYADGIIIAAYSNSNAAVLSYEGAFLKEFERTFDRGFNETTGMVGNHPKYGMITMHADLLDDDTHRAVFSASGEQLLECWCWDYENVAFAALHPQGILVEYRSGRIILVPFPKETKGLPRSLFLKP